MESHLIELDPSVSDVLPLLFPEGSLALWLILEENGTLSGLGAIYILAYLDGLSVAIIILEERADVLRLGGERQPSKF